MRVFLYFWSQFVVGRFFELEKIINDLGSHFMVIGYFVLVYTVVFDIPQQ